MQRKFFSLPIIALFSALLKWTFRIVPLSLAVGSLVALFLWLLDKATETRWEHPWLLYLLPLAGIAIVEVYARWGKNAGSGNDLILDEIHQPGGGIPARMAPLVLVSTVITHLFGGSAGREGTAVQIGGSMAGFIGKKLRFTQQDLQVFLTAGIAAGFGAVFGTPVAGAIFALEVLTIGAIRYQALIPCLIAAVLADQTTSLWGIQHTSYRINTVLPAPFFAGLHTDPWLLLKTVLAGILFGWVGLLFSEASHGIKALSNRFIAPRWLRPVVGALIIIGLCLVLGTDDYLGLGVKSDHPGGISIVNAFHAGGATYWSWFWKLLFTAITLGTGFKGGEVTPLFFIGAALGNCLALLMGAPVDLFAAMGFIAVFAAATNTPVACMIMGVELFGGTYTLYFAIACITAYYFSGHTGIYGAQRIAISKRYPFKSRNNIPLHRLRYHSHQRQLMLRQQLKQWFQKRSSYKKARNDNSGPC